MGGEGVVLHVFIKLSNFKSFLNLIDDHNVLFAEVIILKPHNVSTEVLIKIPLSPEKKQRNLTQMYYFQRLFLCVEKLTILTNATTGFFG